MHAQPHPAICNNPKNIFGIPSSAVSPCEDCAEPTYPSTEITSQCTDQCVVIACSDPEHNEVNQCHGTGDLRCDLVCDGTSSCIDCDGFDQFLQCCTNYHSYFSEPRNADQLSDTSFSWDSSFEEFLCSCSGPGEAPLARTQPVRNPPNPVVSTFDIPADVISPAPPPPHHPTQYAIPSVLLGSGHELLTCMWGNCQASFTTLSELVGHVNLEHLRLPSTPQANLITPIHPDVSPLACQWRDCSIYPSSESIPSSSSGDHVDDVLKFLASHLLHDHLGMNNPPPAPADIAEDEADNSLKSLRPPAEHALRSVSPSPCAGAHKCQWQSCGHTFNTFEGLTSHITVVHIGAGKAQYECFWEGCNRNGSNGFSSKQKICRHLQSHTGHRPYQCAICQQYFSEAATLQQHMRRHTQEKPYVCDYPGCGKTFAITGALTIHKRIHNGQKPFKCKFCDKAFAESSNLSKHLRTHTGARPYCCSEPGCNKSFARPDQLTRHLGVHKKKPPPQWEQHLTSVMV